MKVRGYRVYYIDPGEGINELIDLIKNTKADKLALVVHDRFLLLDSQINLKLIKKNAVSYQKEVVFINPDPIINQKVTYFGFKIYPDLNSLEVDTPYQAEAAGKETEEDGNELIKTKSPFPKVLGLIFIILILVMAYFYFLYPVAVIEIKPVLGKVTHKLNIYGSPTISKIDWGNQILPLAKAEMSVNGEAEEKVTGVKLSGEIKAEGIIKFINERQEDALIPVGTIVQTEEGIKFKTLKELVVPKLKVDYLMDVPVGMKAGQAEVAIEALEKGNLGNVSTGRIKILNKELEQIHVINPEPTRGGKDKRVSVVNEDDLKNLTENLTQRLKSGLLTKFYQEMGGNYRIIEESIEFLEPELNFSHKLGDTTDILQSSGSLSASAYLLRNSELDRLVTSIFKENLNTDFQLISSGIDIQKLSLEEKDKNLYNIQLELLAPVIPKIDTAELAKSVQGTNLAEANLILAERPEIGDHVIKTKLANLPRFSFAIKVIVTEPDSFQVFRENK